jgi:hypothetical protein
MAEYHCASSMNDSEDARTPSPHEEFECLTLVLERYFDKPLEELPDVLRKRVEQAFMVSWERLSEKQRRYAAQEWDYKNDPAMAADRQFWWDFWLRKDEIDHQIAQWEAAATPTASDMAVKEERLAQLNTELARMDSQVRRARGDYPERSNVARIGSTERQSNEFIAYPKAMKLLADRLEATPEELAAWVFMGPNDGGLMAYTNINELNPPPRFHFDYLMGEDYLSPLMACWFRQDDIDRFDPADRYITGAALIERWSNQPSLRPEAFIRAKIAESRLLGIHPTFGGTRGTIKDDSFPPLESGLFLLAHVEGIEAKDFGADEETVKPAVGSCHPVSAALIRQNFTVIRDEDANDKWWKDKMAEAERYGLLECRVGEGKKGRNGGSLWRPDMIAGWLVDRHTNGKEGLPADATRKALKRFPGCEDIAEQMFPEDE